MPSRLTISCRYDAVAERRILATDQAAAPKLFPAEAVAGLAVVAGLGDQLVVRHDVGGLGGERTKSICGSMRSDIAYWNQPRWPR